MKHYLFGLMALATLGGCPTTDDGTTDDGTTDDGTTDDTCDNGIVEFFPDDAATGVYYRTSIEIEFEDGEEEGIEVMVTQAGTAVAGTEEWAGDRWIFWPSEPLTSSTEYMVDVTYSCGTPSIAFTTGEVGTATTDSLVDRAYLLDLAAGRFVEPAGVGSLIGTFLTDVYVLVGVSAEDTGAQTLTMLGALGIDDGGDIVQDTCSASIEFPIDADYAANPYFEVAGENVPIAVEGFEIEIGSMEITGAFAPDASYIDGASLAGKIDTRPLGELFDLGTDENAVCDFLGTLQLACEDCGNGEVFCLSILVDSMSADELADVTLVPLTQDDVDADADCAE